MMVFVKLQRDCKARAGEHNIKKLFQVVAACSAPNTCDHWHALSEQDADAPPWNYLKKKANMIYDGLCFFCKVPIPSITNNLHGMVNADMLIGYLKNRIAVFYLQRLNLYV